MGVEDRNDVPFTTGSFRSDVTGVGIPRLPTPEHFARSRESGRSTILRQCLERILVRDDGYLRLIPGDGGKAAYCKYKWTSGRWGGYYVMTVGHIVEIEDLIDMLESKIAEVDAGVRRPTRDTPHGS